MWTVCGFQFCGSRLKLGNFRWFDANLITTLYLVCEKEIHNKRLVWIVCGLKSSHLIYATRIESGNHDIIKQTFGLKFSCDRTSQSCKFIICKKITSNLKILIRQMKQKKWTKHFKKNELLLIHKQKTKCHRNEESPPDIEIMVRFFLKQLFKCIKTKAESWSSHDSSA